MSLVYAKTLTARLKLDVRYVQRIRIRNLTVATSTTSPINISVLREETHISRAVLGIADRTSADLRRHKNSYAVGQEEGCGPYS